MGCTNTINIDTMFQPDEFYVGQCQSKSLQTGTTKQTYAANEQINLEALVVNQNDVDGSATIEFYVDNELIGTSNAFVESNTQDTVSESFFPADYGYTEIQGLEYEIKAANASKS